MQLYNNSIDIVFDNLEEKTNQISTFLSDIDTLHSAQIDVLMNLYEDRKESLEQIAFWFNSDNKALQPEIKRNIQNRMDKLLKNDADNLIVIKNKLDELANKLRNLNKNKSLLVYIK
ncbi:MAG: hypothetical protein N2319_09825 [Candidatus Kapabacteria bacterium]|nr:hypothetical protein [Candidatus Kapabacteria bacterium]